jgi:ribosomal protein S12 methylthiotransferase
MQALQTDIKKVHLVSLGCARNLVDSEVMIGTLLEKGWQHTSQPNDADAIIVNTCGFIQSAKEESIDTILSFAELKRNKPHMRLIVAGCLAQRYKTQLAKGIPEVDFFVGTDQFSQIANFIENPPEHGSVIAKRANYLYNENLPRVNTLSKFSAYVKVAEGCGHNCAFCIIPAIRGRLRSRPISSVVREVQQLTSQGVKEIILIAQDLAAYGRDRGTDELVPLLRELVAIEDLKWLRMLYMYPENISDEFLDLMASEDKIVKYLDIPVQHASNKVLSKMNRILTQEQMRSVFERVRRKVPGIAIRTTVMVGFPGEDEADAAELVDFLKESRFEHLGCFTYSLEEGTVAGRMADQIDEDIKQRRYDEVMALQQGISRDNLAKLVGKTYSALILKKDEESCRWEARLSIQAPDIDGMVYITGDDLEVGQICSVRITGSLDYDLLADLC